MSRAIAALLCLVLAPAAGASSVDVDRVAADLPIARATWSASPCSGREDVLTGPEADAAIADSGSAPAGGSGVVGAVSWPEQCRVAIHTGFNDYMFCALLVHELGHLAGQEHSSDPANIMSAVLPGNYAPCVPPVFGRRLSHRRMLHLTRRYRPGTAAR